MRVLKSVYTAQVEVFSCASFSPGSKNLATRSYEPGLNSKRIDSDGSPAANYGFPLMAFLRCVLGSWLLTRLTLAALGLYCLSGQPLQACSHPTFVSFSETQGRGASTARPQYIPHSRSTPTSRPYDPLGPCQGPQCERSRPASELPLTTSPEPTPDPWSLALLDWINPTPFSTPLTAPPLSPLVRCHGCVFHPPRAGA